MSRRRTGGSARLVGALLVGVVFVAGCTPNWAMFRSGPTRTGDNAAETTLTAANVVGMHQVWRGPASGVTAPVVAFGVTYVVSGSTLFAFDAAGQTGCTGTPRTCTPLWTAPTSGDAVAVGGGVVLVATDSMLVAYDRLGQTGCSGSPKTCTPLWTSPFSCETGAMGCLPSQPVVANGIAYVGVTSVGTCCVASVQAFSVNGSTGCSGVPKTCLPLRKYVVDCGTGFSCEASPPAVANGVLYAGSYDDEQDFGARGALFAFSATGKTGCSGTPVSCVPLWTGPTLGMRGSPAVANGKVYVTDQSFPDPQAESPSGFVRAFDAAGMHGCSGSPKTCAALWTVSEGPIFGSPAVAGISVYVGALNGNLQVLNATTGQRQWTGNTGNRVDTSPSVAGDVVYVTSNSRLFAFDTAATTAECVGIPKTCRPLANVGSGAEAGVGWEPAIVDGTVFLGGSDKLRAYRLH